MKFEPNIDISTVFHSKVMTLNDNESAENGLCIVEAGADGPPIHKHPFQEETFKIVEGTLQVYKKNKWIDLKVGDELFIPKNTAHTFRSRGEKACLFEYFVTPKGDFTGMLKTFEKLMKNGKLTDNTSLKSKIYLSMVFHHHASEIVSVSPPQFVIVMMSKIGKWLGYSMD